MLPDEAKITIEFEDQNPIVCKGVIVDVSATREVRREQIDPASAENIFPEEQLCFKNSTVTIKFVVPWESWESALSKRRQNNGL